MRIPSEDIPQADVLDEVVRTVEAVSQGARTFDDIAEAIGKVDRQGRYYRRAAEILGLVRNERNHSTLTPVGRTYIRNRGRRKQLLTEAVLQTRLVQRVLPFFEAHEESGVDREDLTDFIGGVTQPVGPSMIPRRVSTVIHQASTESWVFLVRSGRYMHGHLVALVAHEGILRGFAMQNVLFYQCVGELIDDAIARGQ